ncbi:hypothetical protein NPIL_593291 [Nephila pilipes]|uniref:Uncharacterized protein n=1 Tax=Nephila pilipes TaxID=299642 RepID=A0A8X6PSX6_NEPPI|nr:hypothetical protein NPIL_593291 [Nephila pilipes]
MGKCIIVIELPPFLHSHVRLFGSHNITKGLQVALLGKSCGSWCLLVMHYPTKVEDGPHDLNMTAHLGCFFDLRLIQGVGTKNAEGKFHERETCSTGNLPKLYHQNVRMLRVMSSPTIEMVPVIQFLS